MKKNIKFILTIILVAALALPFVYGMADSGKSNAENKLSNAIVLYINSSTALAGGKEKLVDDADPAVAPFISDGRTFIPLRFVSENMGADVSWDGRTKTATITSGANKAEFKLGDKFMRLNGSSFDMEVSPVLINGRTYVPVRVLAENVLGKEVFWHNNLIVISDIKDIFNLEKDAGEISDIISRVNQIPIVGTKDRLMAILKERMPVHKEYTTFFIEEEAPMVAFERDDAGDSVNGSGGSSDYSTTNIQVAGIDEGDIIKTDGEYIYQVNAYKIVIIKAYPADEMKIVSEIEYNRRDMKNPSLSPAEVYVDGNTLVVIGNSWDDKEYTKALIYDIKNKASVKEIREVALEGNYLASRKIDDCIYLIANKYMYNHVIPTYRDTTSGDKYVEIDCAVMRYFPGDNDMNHTFIASFNITRSDEPADITSYLGSGQQIYCGKENLYITKPVYSGSKNYHFYNYDATEIYRFAIGDGKVVFERKGVVKGQPLNQFSMDEYAGHFRIATTEFFRSGGEMTNNLYILSVDDLKHVGKIENMAKGERIYSVRFMGEKGYIVTFRTVDPLFAIDLKDPANPEVLGELKIPGFSQYLHPYDENHIIGFGKDTEVIRENWNGRIVEQAIETGMKMALFDVSDPTSPKELFSTKVGDRGAFSEVLSNHRALLFSKEKDIIAFPVMIYKQEGGGFNYGSVSFQGAIVYGLDLDKGFTLKGKISHTDRQPSEYWYYDSGSAVSRILYIGDVLYTSSMNMVKASDMNSLQEIKSVEIENIYYELYPVVEDVWE